MLDFSRFEPLHRKVELVVTSDESEELIAESFHRLSAGLQDRPDGIEELGLLLANQFNGQIVGDKGLQLHEAGCENLLNWLFGQLICNEVDILSALHVLFHD